MNEFILDVNIELKPEVVAYPGFLIRDLLSTKKVGLVRGGSKYTKEVHAKKKLRDLLIELARAGKLRRVSDVEVDRLTQQLNDQIDEACGKCPAECDDLHLIALCKVSNCHFIFSNDVRIAICKGKVRKKIGHDKFPDVKVIKTERAYKRAVR